MPKDLKTLTKLEREKQIKKEIAQEGEELEATGQESDTKAVKWIQEKQKEDDKKEDAITAVEQTILEDKKKTKFTYRDKLLQVSMRKINEFDCPKGFKWGSYLTEKGLIIWFQDPRKNVASVGMNITNEPKYDINWIDRRIQDTLSLMEQIEKNYETPTTESGIILPS